MKRASATCARHKGAWSSEQEVAFSAVPRSMISAAPVVGRSPAQPAPLNPTPPPCGKPEDHSRTCLA